MPPSPGPTDAPKLLRSSLLEAIGVPHAFTTRRGGRSTGVFSTLNFGNPGDLAPEQRDPPETIAANVELVLGAIGCADRTPVQAHQIHGPDALVAARERPLPSGWIKADAIVTDDPSRLAAVRVADCAPVLIASDDGQVVAAAHAGWRGVISGVVHTAISEIARLGASPSSLVAAVGPCIGPAAFEVGPEVAAEFHRAFPGIDGIVLEPTTTRRRPHVDLKAALRTQLLAAGAGTDRIDVLPHCTVADPELFFSHRRDGGITGRMLALIGPRS